MLEIRSSDEGSGRVEAGGGAGGPGVLEEHRQRDLSGRLSLELERAAPSLADLGGAQRLRPPRALDPCLRPQCRLDGFRPGGVEVEAERTVQVKGLAHRVIAHATMLLVVAVACATPSVAQARSFLSVKDARGAVTRYERRVMHRDHHTYWKLGACTRRSATVVRCHVSQVDVDRRACHFTHSHGEICVDRWTYSSDGVDRVTLERGRLRVTEEATG